MKDGINLRHAPISEPAIAFLVFWKHVHGTVPSLESGDLGFWE